MLVSPVDGDTVESELSESALFCVVAGSRVSRRALRPLGSPVIVRVVTFRADVTVVAAL